MSDSVELIPVREAHIFDEATLADYLKSNLDGFPGNMSVLQFEGGQSNPTFLLSAGNQKWVMRKKPPGKLLPTAHMVDREYRVITALKDTDVPVPATYLLCMDEAIIGTPFYIMEYVEGPVYNDITLPGFSPDYRRALYSDMNRVIAALHTVDYEAVDLTTFGKPGDYIARQIRRWGKQYQMSKTEEIDSMDRLTHWLPDNIPGEDMTTIVHGDFRLGNSIVHPEEPRILAMLDWELATLGHPLADLAYNCLLYHVALPDTVSLQDVAGPESGILTEDEYVAEYCKRTGREEGIENWNFYLAFSLYRLASIAQGVYARGLQGIASSSQALERGKHARLFADTGWSIVEKIS